VKGARRPARGFTLIELMVALVVSSLLVGMILAIFSRMSIAYRGQQQIAGVQQVLAAARATIELDAKQTGLGLSQGFVLADNKLYPPVLITNNNAGPDKVVFFYADPSSQAAVKLPFAWGSSMTVDDTSTFLADQLVVVSSVDLTQSGLNPATDGNIAKYSACVLRIQSLTANTLQFYTSLPFGTPGESHCSAVLPTPSATTMVYKFVAHGYQIDPTRPALGALQLSPTGGLIATDWKDLAYGFTDIQTALQVYHTVSTTVPPAGDTPDLDVDPVRDWYSDGVQDNLTAPTGSAGPPVLAPPNGLLQISISLVARTDREVEGIASSQTPPLVDLLNVANNTIGDRPSVPLPSADPALVGSRIFRYTTFQVDFRNLGVGR